MPVQSSRSSLLLSAAFTLLATLGLAIAALGLGIDFLLPNTSQGFSIAQLLLVAAGLLLALAAFAMRRAELRRRVFQSIRRHWAKVLPISAITLLILEFVLVAMGFGIYYPTKIPQSWLEPVTWWTCDDSGCRYVYQYMMEACSSGEISDRRCAINRQGYHSSRDFAAVEDSDPRTRILTLGDSFTAGFSADIGKSYVETIAADFPDSIVWNTGISATGTNQALASFRKFAPLLRPQITILGFVMNDFDDNKAPIDGYFMGVNVKTNRLLMIRQYQVDVWGNVIKLDLQSDLYYRKRDVDPPASEIKRLIGLTRIGTLVLRLVDALGAKVMADARFNTKLAITRNYLQELRTAAAEQDSALLVVLVPRAKNVDTISDTYQSAIDLMRELEVPFVDPINMLGADDYMPHPDLHWNNAGHQKISALLNACLETFFVSNDLSDCEHVETP